MHNLENDSVEKTSFPGQTVEMACTQFNYYPLGSSRDKSIPISTEEIVPCLVMLLNFLSVLAIDSSISDSTIFNQSLLSLALMLEHSGYRDFIKVRDSSHSVRIRMLVLNNPDRNWCSAYVEECLHMSGATLRRHLAKENTSLRILLRESRLSHGMMLLQTTHKAIKIIAYECGYKPTACFTRNFISHFGIEPSAAKAK